MIRKIVLNKAENSRERSEKRCGLRLRYEGDFGVLLIDTD